MEVNQALLSSTIIIVSSDALTEAYLDDVRVVPLNVAADAQLDVVAEALHNFQGSDGAADVIHSDAVGNEDAVELYPLLSARPRHFVSRRAYVGPGPGKR